MKTIIPLFFIIIYFSGKNNKGESKDPPILYICFYFTTTLTALLTPFWAYA